MRFTSRLSRYTSLCIYLISLCILISFICLCSNLSFHKAVNGPSGIKIKHISERTNTYGSHFAKTHFMTVNPYARTGNQMFHVATLLGTANYHGYTAVIQPSTILTQWFDLPYISNITLEYAYNFVSKEVYTFYRLIPFLPHAYNYSLSGNFHSWRYFIDAKDIVRDAFKFKANISKKITVFLRNVVSLNHKKVCIHIRRGDFLDTKVQQKGISVAPIEYISNAVVYFRRKYNKVHFIAISMDKLWCNINLHFDNLTITPFNTTGEDLCLLANCDDVIITGGTFGWWGGWLSGGDVVYWKGFPRKGSPLYSRFNFSDYYPRHWIGMD